MKRYEFIKVQKTIRRLSIKYTARKDRAFEYEKKLSAYVTGIIESYGLESDLEMFKEIIDLLPDCNFQTQMAERYADLKKAIVNTSESNAENKE